MKALLYVAASVAALSLALPAQAQKPVAYPAKGQSAEQQKKDDYECHNWAVGQSGVDPTKPPPAPPPAAAPPTTATGTTPGAGVRGAARGAVVGEIVADDARSGAAVGAVAARGQSRRQNAQAQQQQASAAPTQNLQPYYQAYGACMGGRGYSVK